MPVKSFSHRILGVDPGTQFLGFALIEPFTDEIRILAMDTIRLKDAGDHQDKLREIFLQLQELIETYRPGQMAIEAPFYGKNVQAMLKLGRAQGVAIAAGITMGLEIYEYSPKRIKQAVTGNGNAAKEQVAAMLSHILKKPVQADRFDATDALACAICHHQQGQGFSPSPGRGKKYNSWKGFLEENPGRTGKPHRV